MLFPIPAAKVSKPSTAAPSANAPVPVVVLVTFSAGTKDVFCTLPASKSVFLDASGTPVGAASAGFALAMAVAL